MKKVVNVGLAGRSFQLDEDAYEKLRIYLNAFKSKINTEVQYRDVMDDLERRISELFTEKLGNYKDVVNLQMVNDVISQLGLPDGSAFNANESKSSQSSNSSETSNTYGGYGNISTHKKILYRDSDNKVFGGVASGLGLYFDIDPVLIRVIFVLLFVFGASGLLIYVILWIAIPIAVTPLQKCQMYGYPITAENLSRFASI